MNSVPYRRYGTLHTSVVQVISLRLVQSFSRLHLSCVIDGISMVLIYQFPVAILISVRILLVLRQSMLTWMDAWRKRH